jgi:hypothetical protein
MRDLTFSGAFAENPVSRAKRDIGDRLDVVPTVEPRHGELELTEPAIVPSVALITARSFRARTIKIFSAES